MKLLCDVHLVVSSFDDEDLDDLQAMLHSLGHQENLTEAKMWSASRTLRSSDLEYGMLM